MEVTYMLIVSVVAYILGAVDRLFMETIPNRFIPIQNVIVGLISGIVCYFADIETNLFNSIIICIVASQAAGGMTELFQPKKNENITVVSNTSEVYEEEGLNE